MKTIKRLSLCAIFALCSLCASAYDFSAENEDGVTIYYNVVSSADLTCEVTNNGYLDTYSGSVAIPEMVSRISDGLIYTTVGIGSSAFECYVNSSSSIEVMIPSTIKYIGNSAFRFSAKLTSINIPNSVIAIGESAFEECTRLTSLTLGNSVSTIGYDAFYDCYSLEQIYSLNPEPPSCGQGVFDGIDDNLPLFVPIGSREKYMYAERWWGFNNIVEMDMTGIESVIASSDNAEVVGYYTIDGKAVDAPQRGVNIVKYSDGTTKKVLVK